MVDFPAAVAAFLNWPDIEDGSWTRLRTSDGVVVYPAETRDDEVSPVRP